MSGSTTELIKEKLDIADFLKGYLNLQQAGKNFKALCPFHKEKTASFMISPDRQSWHCFGCGLGGDIFAFLMRYENVEFGEALRVLAEKAGVELRRLNPAEYKFTGLLFELNEKAKDFFKLSLGKFEPAKKYLAGRGLLPETISEFEIGWAPAGTEALSAQLLKFGHAPDDIMRAGLALKNERGALFDRFRGRIMFPIHNHSGKVAGFTGRILDSVLPENAADAALAKYVNSPETPIFGKSKLLYGFWKSRNFIREVNSVFLVEGQMDMLMSWQAGVKNVVASSGTALGSDHLKTLRRTADTLILSFDSDEAGSVASERAIDLAEREDFSVRIVQLGNFKDPAEAAQAGPDHLRAAIGRAVSAPAFYFDKYLPQGEDLDFSRRELLRGLRVVLTKLLNISSPVEKSSWFAELSRRTGIQEKFLAEEADKLAAKIGGAKETCGDSEDSGSVSLGERHYTRREVIGEKLLRAAVAKSDFLAIEDCFPYLAQSHQEIFNILKGGARRSSDPRLDELLSYVVFGSEQTDASEIAVLKKELVKEHLKDRRRSIAMAIRRAEETGDETTLQSALEELNSLNLPVFES